MQQIKEGGEQFAFHLTLTWLYSILWALTPASFVAQLTCQTSYASQVPSQILSQQRVMCDRSSGRPMDALSPTTRLIAYQIS